MNFLNRLMKPDPGLQKWEQAVKDYLQAREGQLGLASKVPLPR
jgi:hypothetical protein